MSWSVGSIRTATPARLREVAPSHVFKSGGRQEHDASPLALQQGIGGDRRAIRQQRQLHIGQQFVKSAEHGDCRI